MLLQWCTPHQLPLIPWHLLLDMAIQILGRASEQKLRAVIVLFPHFPLSYLIFVFLSGTESESCRETNWFIIRDCSVSMGRYDQRSAWFPPTSHLQLIDWFLQGGLHLHHSYSVLVQSSLHCYAFNLNSGTLVSVILELICFSSLKKIKIFIHPQMSNPANLFLFLSDIMFLLYRTKYNQRKRTPIKHNVFCNLPYFLCFLLIIS
jgi:hypothetical protein